MHAKSVFVFASFLSRRRRTDTTSWVIASLKFFFIIPFYA